MPPSAKKPLAALVPDALAISIHRPPHRWVARLLPPVPLGLTELGAAPSLLAAQEHLVAVVALVTHHLFDQPAVLPIGLFRPPTQ